MPTSAVLADLPSFQVRPSERTLRNSCLARRVLYSETNVTSLIRASLTTLTPSSISSRITLPSWGSRGAEFGAPVARSSLELRVGTAIILALYFFPPSVIITLAPTLALRSEGRSSAIWSIFTLRRLATTEVSFALLSLEYGQYVPSTGVGR